MMLSCLLRIDMIIIALLCACLLALSLPQPGDTLKTGENLTDSESNNLVSIGGQFELGFFSPSASSERYLGIWYHSLEPETAWVTNRNSPPQTVVWVANRDNPVLDSSGIFQITEDGNLSVIDTKGTRYWSSGLKEVSSLTSWTVKLMDSGNLILRDDQLKVIWQSFEHPTDTFLVNMNMDKNLVLTSWRAPGDPRSGDFTFKMGNTGDDVYRIYKNRSQVHWEGETLVDFGPEGVPSIIVSLLTNFTATPKTFKNKNFSAIPSRSDYGYTRLVINSTGVIQLLRWEKLIGWNPQWLQPDNKCNIYNYCGNFRICNLINSRPHCNCLPGFIPPSQEENQSSVSGESIKACSRNTTSCGENKTTFINLKMMKVRNPDEQVHAAKESDCRSECRKRCPHCRAYSYDASRSVAFARSSITCFIWTSDLPTLQEESLDDGSNLSVLVNIQDIEPNARTCAPCGAYTIPYPLSTNPSCGDPIYNNFHCNVSTGQVSFNVGNDSYGVTDIDPNSRTFSIPIEDSSYCDDGKNPIQLPPSFNVTRQCYGADEVQINWLPPQEPPCTKPIDCKSWPRSTCKATRNGTRRCICDKNYRWNGSDLNCTPETDVLPSSKEPPRHPLPLILGVTFSSVIFLACIVTSAYFWRRKVAHKQEREKVQKMRKGLYDSERYVKDLIDTEGLEAKDNEGIEVPYFDFESILLATDSFSDANMLGRGGYGPVYKGKLPGGQDIAVKRLSSVSSQGLKEFKNEVVLISKLQHRNLVRLRGYCIRGEEKILLYEYMANKSLDAFIFDHTQGVILDWQMRYDIILGIARGMLYLHQDSRLRVIHRDLKTSNILLDEEIQPKISDFGLARIFGGKEIEANTERVVGTYGYMSPEYALDGLFSIKSDVFSFGVVMLEIISGKKNSGFFQSQQFTSILGYAWRLWAENKLVDLMDPSLSESCNVNQFVRCAQVSLLCVQDEPGDRPTMSQVLIILESETASLPTPKQPTFFMTRGLSSDASSSKPELSLSIESTSQQGQ